MFVRTPRGRVQVSATTVAIRDGRILHLLTRAAPGRDRALGLTRRQHEVLDLMAQGLQAKAIAERLGVTRTTVRTHIRAILREFGAHSQLEALAKARAQGAFDA
jgi:DNA-binding CsgD family transcriptional regulator